jgi:CheY-like chemotaxis protein
VRTSRRPDGAAAIEVEDNGSGIPPEMLPRLFDPFFTTKAPGEGTGLGLSVCHSIVAALDGRIEVTTEVDAGTTFRVILPAAPPLESTAPAPPPAAAPAPRRRQVLVIDDEPVVRQMVAAMLRAGGCDVTEADGGRAGLALALGPRRFDAIVCDLVMPDVDGAAIHATVAAADPAAARRLVFITGGAVSPQTGAFLARDDVAVLAKPFGLDALLAVIERVASTT